MCLQGSEPVPRTDAGSASGCAKRSENSNPIETGKHFQALRTQQIIRSKMKEEIYNEQA